MNKLRITIITPPPNLTGGIRVIAIYANYLAQKGHCVSIYYPTKSTKGLKGSIKKLFSTIKEIFKPKTTHFHNLSPNISVNTFKHYTFCEKSLPNADILLCTWWETIEWVDSFPSSKGKQVHFIQDYEAFFPEHMKRINAVYNNNNFKIVVSDWLKKHIALNHHSKKIVVISNSVDSNHFKAIRKGKNENIFKVGFYYSGAERKKPRRAIQAFKAFRKKVNTNAELVAFGSHHIETESIRKSIDKYFCKPTQDEIVEIYASCDVWLFCSDNEGFGLPILEAMSCGTPVIAFATSAAPEILSASGGSLITEINTELMAVEILRYYMMDDASWLEISDSARIKASSYTWQDAGLQFENSLLDFVKR